MRAEGRFSGVPPPTCSCGVAQSPAATAPGVRGSRGSCACGVHSAWSSAAPAVGVWGGSS
eukprot:scaffold49631_cov19-Tisochrysis_lutea.AAC.1